MPPSLTPVQRIVADYCFNHNHRVDRIVGGHTHHCFKVGNLDHTIIILNHHNSVDHNCIESLGTTAVNYDQNSRIAAGYLDIGR